MSTRDVASYGGFTLLTGIGGKKAWEGAAQYVASRMDVEVKAYSVGFGQDYEDTFFGWFEKRGVDEKGCVLVRPDRVVAWRSKGLVGGGEGEACGEKLLVIMRKVLGFEGPVIE